MNPSYIALAAFILACVVVAVVFWPNKDRSGGNDASGGDGDTRPGADKH